MTEWVEKLEKKGTISVTALEMSSVKVSGAPFKKKKDSGKRK